MMGKVRPHLATQYFAFKPFLSVQHKLYAENYTPWDMMHCSQRFTPVLAHTHSLNILLSSDVKLWTIPTVADTQIQ